MFWAATGNNFTMRALHNLLAQILKPILLYVSRGRLPVQTGRLLLPGLEAPVTVAWDRWSVPSIEARTRADLYQAQGYLYAQDRLFQLDLHRLVALGELSAVVGSAGLLLDRLTRTLGFAHLAKASLEHLSDRTREYYAAYARGINAFLDTSGGLPIEFSILRHRPRAWTIEDSLAVARLQAWTLTRGWSGEHLREQLRAQVGEILAGQIDPGLQWQARRGEDEVLQLLQATLDGPLGQAVLVGGRDDRGIGSNAWAVGPAHTADGQPLLANDIHLPLSAPGFWYLARHQCLDPEQPLRAAGAVLPGSPMIVVGQNESIGWGITLAYTDCSDLFIEKPAPGREDAYLVDGEVRPFVERREVIAVRGGDPVTLAVRSTHHGPLVGDLLFPADGRLIALRSPALDADLVMSGLGRLVEVGSWAEFQEAAADIHAPPLTLIYADHRGNIGRQLAGRIPIRARGDGLTPRPGWDSTFDWQGYRPAGDLPSVFNPAEGFVMACNHDVGDGSPDYGYVWMSGWRVRRLAALFVEAVERGPIAISDMADWQRDTVSLPGLEFRELLREFSTEDPRAAECLAILRDWSGEMAVDSAGAAVFAALQQALADLLLPDSPAGVARLELLGYGPHPALRPVSDWAGHWPAAILGALRDPGSGWVPGSPGRQALLEEALRLANQILRGRLGGNPRLWRWGDLHRARFLHPLGIHPVLGRIFALDPLELPGNSDTLWQTATAANPAIDPFAAGGTASCYRQIVTPGKPEQSAFLTLPGQSGRLGSAHFDDLVAPWMDGRLLPMVSPADSEGKERLFLIPTGQDGL